MARGEGSASIEGRWRLEGSALEGRVRPRRVRDGGGGRQDHRDVQPLRVERPHLGFPEARARTFGREGRPWTLG